MQINLHILSKTNIPEAVLNSSSEDAIVLINEAVYILLQKLPESILQRKLYVLNDDWHARFQANHDLPGNAQLIDYARFVDLCAQYTKSITW